MSTISTVEIVTPPDSEPVTLAVAKQHLRVPSVVVEDDEYITSLIQSSREDFENDTGGFVCLETEFLERFDNWPLACAFGEMAEFKLNRRPLIEVTSIEYLDADGDLQTLDTDIYQVDGHRTFPAVSLAFGETWPTIRGDRGGIRITYMAGHEAVGDIPQNVKQAILLKIGERFENRQSMTEKAPGFDAWQAIVNKYLRCDYP